MFDLIIKNARINDGETLKIIGIKEGRISQITENSIEEAKKQLMLKEMS